MTCVASISNAIIKPNPVCKMVKPLKRKPQRSRRRKKNRGGERLAKWRLLQGMLALQEANKSNPKPSISGRNEGGQSLIPMKIKEEVEDEGYSFASSNEFSMHSQFSNETIPPGEMSANYATASIENIAHPTKRPNDGAIASSSSKKPRVFVRCELCLNQFFSSVTDLEEHCSTFHSRTNEQTQQHAPSGILVRPTDHPEMPPEQAPVKQYVPSGILVRPTDHPEMPPEEPTVKQYPSSADLKTILVSLNMIPLYRRRATKDKILELVDFIAKQGLNPSSIKFSVDL